MTKKMCMSSAIKIQYGHVCAAISYAYLKNEVQREMDRTVSIFLPEADISMKETQYVLKYFDVPSPLYVSDIRPQVSDIEIRKTAGIPAVVFKKSLGYYAASRIVFDSGK